MPTAIRPHGGVRSLRGPQVENVAAVAKGAGPSPEVQLFLLSLAANAPVSTREMNLLRPRASAADRLRKSQTTGHTPCQAKHEYLPDGCMSGK